MVSALPGLKTRCPIMGYVVAASLGCLNAFLTSH